MASLGFRLGDLLIDVLVAKVLGHSSTVVEVPHMDAGPNVLFSIHNDVVVVLGKVANELELTGPEVGLTFPNV